MNTALHTRSVIVTAGQALDLLQYSKVFGLAEAHDVQAFTPNDVAVTFYYTEEQSLRFSTLLNVWQDCSAEEKRTAKLAATNSEGLKELIHYYWPKAKAPRAWGRRTVTFTVETSPIIWRDFLAKAQAEGFLIS